MTLVTSSITSKRYKGQISKMSEDEAKKELWSFGTDPMIRMFLQQPRKS